MVKGHLSRLLLKTKKYNMYCHIRKTQNFVFLLIQSKFEYMWHFTWLIIIFSNYPPARVTQHWEYSGFTIFTLNNKDILQIFYYLHMLLTLITFFKNFSFFFHYLCHSQNIIFSILRLVLTWRLNCMYGWIRFLSLAKFKVFLLSNYGA